MIGLGYAEVEVDEKGTVLFDKIPVSKNEIVSVTYVRAIGYCVKTTFFATFYITPKQYYELDTILNLTGRNKEEAIFVPMRDFKSIQETCAHCKHHDSNMTHLAFICQRDCVKEWEIDGKVYKIAKNFEPKEENENGQGN